MGGNSNIINNNAFGSSEDYDLEFEGSNAHGNAAGLVYSGNIPGCDFDTRPCRVFHNLILTTD